MARIISFQQSLERYIAYAACEYCRESGFTSINLETVRGMNSGFQGYSKKKVEVKRSFWDKLFGKPDFYFVDDTSRPVYWLKLQYKNHRQRNSTFYFDKEEFERVKAEVARHGWLI